ncbi:MAG: hypothetical protein AABX14_02205, partial [Candidatus Aenigmatarchaeota archaeon]
MLEVRSRRHFLTRDIPAMTYGVAAAPSLFQPQDNHREILYGEIRKDGKFVPYSWQKIRNVMGLKRSNEESFYQRLGERYAELTDSYDKATGSMPDFRRLFGLDRDNFFTHLSVKDIPKGEADSVIDMDDIIGGDAQRVKRVKNRLSYPNGDWSLGATDFADGNRTIMAGSGMPIHRKGEDTHDVYAGNGYFFVQQYSDGTRIYIVEIVGADDEYGYKSDHAPPEYRRRLMNTRTVKTPLKEPNEATKLNMAPNCVVFDH